MTLPLVLLPEDDTSPVSLIQVTSQMAYKGLSVTGASSSDESILAKLKENKDEIIIVTEDARYVEELDRVAFKNKQETKAAIFWTSEKEKPVCNKLPVVSINDFLRAKFLYNWEGFCAMGSQPVQPEQRQDSGPLAFVKKLFNGKKYTL